MGARYWAVTDLETTGLDPRKHEIIQIARVVVDTVERCIVPELTLSRYVYPVSWSSRSLEAMDVNKIHRDTLDTKGILLDAALRDFSRGVNWSNTVVAAWGLDFELKFLEAGFAKSNRIVPYTWKGIDVRSQFQLEQARRRVTEYLGLRDACLVHSVEFDPEQAHDALYDASKTAELALELLSII